MGIIVWITLGMAVGLLANMLLPGKRTRALIFICLTCFTGALPRQLGSQPVPRARSVQLLRLACRPRRSSGPARSGS